MFDINQTIKEVKDARARLLRELTRLEKLLTILQPEKKPTEVNDVSRKRMSDAAKARWANRKSERPPDNKEA